MRITNFAPYNSHTNNLFNNNKILKFEDIIKFFTKRLKQSLH